MFDNKDQAEAEFNSIVEVFNRNTMYTLNQRVDSYVVDNVCMSMRVYETGDSGREYEVAEVSFIHCGNGKYHAYIGNLNCGDNHNAFYSELFAILKSLNLEHN